jgi:hypothetical protein
MKTSEVYARYRKAFQVIAFASCGLLLALANADLFHAPYRLYIAVLLMLVVGLSVVLGMIYAYKELSAQRAELRYPSPDPDRPWQVLNKKDQ